MAVQDPVYQRERLRERLTKARKAADFTQRQVAEALDWSPSKIIRIEKGVVGVSVTDVRVLLAHYGVEDADQIQALANMARAAKQPPWWNPYRSVASPDFLTYLGYEGSASIIRNFEPNLVPGLLQTEEYAQAVLNQLAPKNAEQLLALRIERQDLVFERENKPELFFILDEAVIRRTVESVTVMRGQLEKLLQVDEQENVSVRIVPFSAGIYKQFRSPYVIFEFEDDEDDLVAYVESPDGEVLVSEKAPGKAGQRRPTDYLDDFWQVEKNVSVPVTRELLFG